MFFGRYDCAIDAKGRLNFPARFRDGMGESFVVMEWLDQCLFALPMAEVERISADRVAAPRVWLKRRREICTTSRNQTWPSNNPKQCIHASGGCSHTIEHLGTPRPRCIGAAVRLFYSSMPS